MLYLLCGDKRWLPHSISSLLYSLHSLPFTPFIRCISPSTLTNAFLHSPSLRCNSTQCKACPNRTFADIKGLTQCKVCQAGTKYDGALLVTATSEPCAGCPAGTYRDHNRSDTAVDNECARCDLGMSSVASAVSCTACTPGKIGRFVDGTPSFELLPPWISVPLYNPQSFSRVALLPFCSR